MLWRARPGGGGTRTGSDRKTWFWELWEAQKLRFQAFLSLAVHAQGGGGGGRARAVTERPGFGSFGRPKSSVFKPFCHWPCARRGGGGAGAHGQ